MQVFCLIYKNSCSPSCKQRGNCCFDYENSHCDNFFILAARKSDECEKNENCDSCSQSKLADGSSKCNQCKSGVFRYEGKCYTACPEDTNTDSTNNICVKKNDCNLENCSICGINNSECKVCKRGFFLNENKCLELCPLGLRADRITWTCLEPPVFAWYWVYPSRTTCKSHCGVVISEDWDCSCASDCFRNGNCCQDIEDHCAELLFWRKSKVQKKQLKGNNIIKKDR